MSTHTQLTLESPPANPRILGPSEVTDREIRDQWAIMGQEPRHNTDTIPADEYELAREKEQAEHLKWYDIGRTDHLRFEGKRNWIRVLNDDLLVLNYWHAYAEGLLPHNAYWQGIRDALAQEAAARGIEIPDVKHTTPAQQHRNCPRCCKAFGWEATR